MAGTTEQAAIPMDLAPVDNTMIRLLVEWTPGADVWAPLTDELQSWTFGFNGFEHTGEDVWQYVGWSWSQDCFHDCRTDQGWPKPIGWLPIAGPSTEGRGDGSSGDGGLATLAEERDRALSDNARLQSALAAMQADRDAVAEALKPFAALGGGTSTVEADAGLYFAAYYDCPSDLVIYQNSGAVVTVGDVRTARRVVSRLPTTGGQATASLRNALAEAKYRLKAISLFTDLKDAKDVAHRAWEAADRALAEQEPTA